MLTHHTAFELSRERVRLAEERATLVTTLGGLPKTARLSLFRRDAKPLSAAVEVRRPSEKERIRRRLLELSAATVRTEQKAS
jgi:hypothetical protein